VTGLAIACVVGWPVLVLAWAWRSRPRRRLDLAIAHLSAEPASIALGARVDRVARPLGAALRRVARRPPDRAADRWVGVVAIVAAIATIATPVLGGLCIAVGAALPPLRRRREARRHTDAVLDELPQVVDLLSLAAGSGLTALLAVGVAAERCEGPVGTALARARRTVELGGPPEPAFGAVISELGEPVRPLVSALLASIRDGSPLEGALERAGHEARAVRRRRAEAVARKVPVRLLFPLVLCTLPAFALLTVVPLLMAALGSLHA
jgi:tight adherence protein C